MHVNTDLSYQRETAAQLFLGSGSSADTGSVESCSCSYGAGAAFPVPASGGELLRSPGSKWPVAPRRAGVRDGAHNGVLCWYTLLCFHSSPQLKDIPRHQIQWRGSCVLHPIDNSTENGKGRASTWGRGCPQGGDQQKPAAGAGAKPERPLLPHLDMKPPLGSDAGFDLVSKHLLFKGLLEVPALLLFWCLCCIIPPCFCIYLFPSSCWSCAWPGTSSFCPSRGIPSPEKPPSAEMGAQRWGRGPCVLIPCCKASPISPALMPPTPQLWHHVRAVPVLLVPQGKRPYAVNSNSSRDPRLFSRRSRGAALPEPRPFPRWSSRRCGRAFPPRTICISLCFKVPALPPRKEINSVKEFTSRARLLLRQVSSAAERCGGAGGAAMEWWVCPWCLSCPRP